MRPFVSHLTKIQSSNQCWRRHEPQDLIIEIGAGAGLHAINFAKMQPEKTFIAIEKTREKFAKLKRRQINHPELSNLITIHANAIDWIYQNITANEVSEYFILYPNPYPKKSQANKRFHQMPFMHYLIQTLKINGKITFATNIESLAAEIKTSMQNTWQFNLINEQSLTLASIARTHFEKKYLLAGETCFNLVFSR